jgi:hypothetical protein
MPIAKTVTTPNGVPCSYHKAVSGEFAFADGVVVIRIGSWYDKATHDAAAGVVWVWPQTLPIAQAADVETALINSPTSEFFEGTPTS